jgi:hypothetical protein
MLSRLRALARRQQVPALEPEAAPVRLQVAENPNWSATGEPGLEGLGLGLREWRTGPEEEAPEVAAGLSEPVGTAADEVAPDRPPSVLSATGDNEPKPDPAAALLQQLEEDNRDLKAALCQLIRIAEQNYAAVRLLEEENEELSALVHRLTVEPASPSARPAPARRPAWMPGWALDWWRRGVARRCL